MNKHGLPLWDTAWKVTHSDLFHDPKHSTTNRWVYRSPKTGKVMGLVGDMRFMAAVLLTGDVHVASFSDEESITIPYKGPKGEALSTHPDFVVDLVGGGKRLVTTMAKKEQKATTMARINALSIAAERAGATHKVIYRDAVNETLFDNWALLSARMNCADPGRFDCSHEQRVLSSALESGRDVRLVTLLSGEGVDSARMLSSLGFALMRGVAKTNLTTALLSLDSIISHN
ncbi:hypothetical protein [Trinickia mobilis]|uniref:hypothetical protein n=1 Tax=Trinickia mobilis TaxID=2816356 RepID=UPI001A8D14C2|nr:hypothetical protein [Trinickia mobilis]